MSDTRPTSAEVRHAARANPDATDFSDAAIAKFADGDPSVLAFAAWLARDVESWRQKPKRPVTVVFRTKS